MKSDHISLSTSLPLKRDTRDIYRADYGRLGYHGCGNIKETEKIPKKEREKGRISSIGKIFQKVTTSYIDCYTTFP